MALTDTQIKALRAAAKRYKKADEKGLSLHVFPNGSKLWRFKYRLSGKEGGLALGAYPDVSLAEARKKRDAARALVANGINPSLDKQRARLAAQIAANECFDRVADEFIAKREAEGLATATVDKLRYFRSLLSPAIGRMPVSDVDIQLLLAALKKIEGKGNYEAAKRSRSFASRVFRYAIQTGRATRDPAQSLDGALISVPAKHYAAILEPPKVGGLLRAIDSFEGHPTTCFALKIAPHVFVRPGELRWADWSELNFEKAVWSIPANRMKARRPHAIPLSSQVCTLFQSLKELVGGQGFVFPAMYNPRRPMSENTINLAFRRMGYGPDEITAHGLRSTASSLLNESGLWSPDAIERALAHGFSDAVRGTYHRGQHWDERVKMAQWWSDYLDDLKATVPPTSARPTKQRA